MVRFCADDSLEGKGTTPQLRDGRAPLRQLDNSGNQQHSDVPVSSWRRWLQERERKDDAIAERAIAEFDERLRAHRAKFGTPNSIEAPSKSRLNATFPRSQPDVESVLSSSLFDVNDGALLAPHAAASSSIFSTETNSSPSSSALNGSPPDALHKGGGESQNRFYRMCASALQQERKRAESAEHLLTQQQQEIRALQDRVMSMSRQSVSAYSPIVTPTPSANVELEAYANAVHSFCSSFATEIKRELELIEKEQVELRTRFDAQHKQSLVDDERTRAGWNDVVKMTDLCSDGILRSVAARDARNAIALQCAIAQQIAMRTNGVMAAAAPVPPPPAVESHPASAASHQTSSQLQAPLQTLPFEKPSLGGCSVDPKVLDELLNMSDTNATATTAAAAAAATVIASSSTGKDHHSIPLLRSVNVGKDALHEGCVCCASDDEQDRVLRQLDLLNDKIDFLE